MKSDLEQAYDYCQEITRRSATNFYYGFLLLPRVRRRGIYAAYAFARECDDIADGELPFEEAKRRLSDFREVLERALAGKPEGPVMVALKDVAERFHVPAEHLFGLIDGVEMDLSTRRFQTFGDLVRYCRLVASTIGLISAEIFGCGGGLVARGYASDLGIAFQLTNILRDIREDAARGRLYLPLEEISYFGCREEDLMEGKVTSGFSRLMAFQIERARGYYTEGHRLLPYLPRRARACVGAMAGIYGEILEDIARRPGSVFQTRVSLGTGQKLAVAGRELVRSFAP